MNSTIKISISYFQYETDKLNSIVDIMKENFLWKLIIFISGKNLILIIMLSNYYIKKIYKFNFIYEVKLFINDIINLSKIINAITFNWLKVVNIIKKLI